jgi:hypothetical protein
MGAIRHIAAIPSDTEQRCLRCCEVIVKAGRFGGACWFPGSRVVRIGDRSFAATIQVQATDCKAVDLVPREELDRLMELSNV